MDHAFPDQRTLEAALVRALKSKSGVATNSEISEFVAQDLELTVDQRTRIHQGARTEFEYRLAWVRSRAKAKGLISRVSPKTWKLLS
jgi:hypothetical protein